MEYKRKMAEDDDINFDYANKKARPSLYRWKAFEIDDEQSIPQWFSESSSQMHETDEEMEEQTTQMNHFERLKSKETNVVDVDENDEMFDNDLYRCHILQSLLSIMRPGETVDSTVKRLAAAVISHKPKQRLKQRKTFLNESPMEDSKKTKLLLEEMTGLIDRFLSNSQIDIYKKTYEHLQNDLNQIQTILQI